MDATAFEFLLGAAGQDLLHEVESSYDVSSAATLAISERLRIRFAPDQVAAALTQAELRRKAEQKFGADAARMYFTLAGLEQATHRTVADHRAQRVRRLGAASLLDLGCGIGSDAVAMARAGLRVSAVERDRVTSMVAAANLSALGLTGSVTVGDATLAERYGYDVVFVDPARRAGTGRIFDPAAYEPPWAFVEQLLAGTAGAKVAPGIPHTLVPAGVEAQWVSLDGRLKETALWSGRLASCARRATVLGDDVAELTDADDPGAPPTGLVGAFVYEPDDAVIRAGLVAAVADLVDGWLLDPHIAYVSSDRLRVGPLARAYEVIDVLPFKEKQLRSALRARGIGPLTIKKRGVKVAPEILRKRLALKGPAPATIIVTRTPRSAVSLLVEPVT